MQRLVSPWPVVGLCIVAAIFLGSTVAAQQQITLSLEKQHFIPAEIRVPAHTAFVLTIVNKDKDEEEFEISALRIEKMIPGGKTLQLKMPALKPGTYEFVGEFHEDTAKGRIIAE